MRLGVPVVVHVLLFCFCLCCDCFSCVGGFAFVGVGVRAPDGMFAGEAHFVVGGCTVFFVGVAVAVCSWCSA